MTTCFVYMCVFVCINFVWPIFIGMKSYDFWCNDTETGEITAREKAPVRPDAEAGMHEFWSGV